ncbi:SDR family NAD(P)-dependent oxidoreductase [Petroclostridium sp. X23]|uniref:SDR family NAD(P)-dependent oxidoreductase n=1 Tax=Petroclostridium sp. X23 TaxID=3045146 RepID=UPI0024AD79FE|nr:SDR family NAD(P)-dependent oxidoreductase [Petroclostridium sp. X23]WHH61248.1 SDR family NAD(P)-dependent oxidoreductase [Petroclostridium sp. X23]
MRENTAKATLDFFQLEGQSAIVTGAGNGIGRSVALILAGLGAKVAVCDIEADSAVAVVREIEEKGGTAIACPCNVCLLEDVKKTVEATVNAFGTVDILVNNAGGGGGGKRLEDMTYPEWDRLIQLNLTSAYMFSMEVLPCMRKQKRGKICNVSSGAGIVGDFSDVHYAASKAGMLGMTKEMARELAKDHINVNALGTGLTDTRMSRRRGLEQASKEILWPRVGTPEDQAYSIVFLVSEAAEYLTGQMICPNGGSWM